MKNYQILNKERLSCDVMKMQIHAPDVAAYAAAGQFLVLMTDEKGERIPLTIAACNEEKSAVTVIFQEIGFSTKKLALKDIGDCLFACLGPLGHATDVKKWGTVVCVAGGVGVVEILSVARAYKQAGNRLVVIVGVRTKELLVLENELKLISDEYIVTTDDGSDGRQGLVTDALSDLLKESLPHLVYAVGPLVMMEAVAELTKPMKVVTIASLNPIMVDATGMCGVCRCRLDGKTVFACVDGPDFDAHKIDFKELKSRLGFYKDEEQSKNEMI